jgi:hypothetical protein
VLENSILLLTTQSGVVVLVLVTVAVDMIVAGAGDAGVGGISTHSLQPLLSMAKSDSHRMLVVGVTPLGPFVPEYASPFTVSVSKSNSVLKLSITIGAANAKLISNVHVVSEPYFCG